MMTRGSYFSAGGNHELRGLHHHGHPLEALLYDAIRRVPNSRADIFSYFRQLSFDRKPVPPQVQNFIAYLLGALADGTISDKDILGGKVIRPLTPAFSAVIDHFKTKPRTENNKRLQGGDTASVQALNDAATYLKWVRPEMPTDHIEQYIHFNLRPADSTSTFPATLLKARVKDQKSRTERIEAVQKILDQFYMRDATLSRLERHNQSDAWHKELDEIYKGKKLK